jgi:hypothetical protein
MPQLAQQLEQALALYVQLATRASTPAEGAPATAEAGGAAAQPPVPAAAVVTGACRLAADLAETLDDLFLAAMLTEVGGCGEEAGAGSRAGGSVSRSRQPVLQCHTTPRGMLNRRSQAG